jgi:hypothetical protein
LETLEERLPPGALLGAATWTSFYPFWFDGEDTGATFAGGLVAHAADEQDGTSFVPADSDSSVKAHPGVAHFLDAANGLSAAVAPRALEVPLTVGEPDSDFWLTDRATSVPSGPAYFLEGATPTRPLIDEGFSAASAYSPARANSNSGQLVGSLLSTSGATGKAAQSGMPSVLHAARSAAAPQGPLRDNLARLPLSFVANEGQASPRTQFMSAGNGYTVFLAANEAMVSLHGSAAPDGTSPADAPAATVVHMQVVGARADTPAVGQDQLPGKVNYFVGNNAWQWRTGTPTFARVEYANIYPGINLDYYGNRGQLEYDFSVAPGVDPAAISLAFGGAERLDLDPKGELVLQTGGGPLTQHRPVLYQEVGEVRHEVSGGYVRTGPQQVGFQVGPYDTRLPLVIDPVLAYSTYLGGSGQEDAFGMAVDANGYVYLTGETNSTDFPTTPGAVQGDYRGQTSNAFVTKLDPSGTSLVYSTFLGGERRDRGNAIAVDAAGNAYIAGRTNSMSFPTTPGAYQTQYGGDEFDAFVTKLSPAGDQLSYSTYLGGSSQDAAFGIAVDQRSDAFVTGGTQSDDFPITGLTAYQYSNLGTSAFMTELNPAGNNLLYSTYLGGSLSQTRGNAIAVDANGYVYITGQTPSPDFPTKNAFQPDHAGNPYINDAFVAKFDPTASRDASLVYSTFLGGSGDDRGLAIAVDSEGYAYVTGETFSTDFPTLNPLQADHRGDQANAFVAKIGPGGDTLVFSTYLGGNGDNLASAVALDAMNNIYLTGYTTAADFPTMNPIQSSLHGSSNALVVEMDAMGAGLVFSTYLGGSGHDNLDSGRTHTGGIGVDAAGNIYVVGKTDSPDFPTMNPLQPNLAGEVNAFVAKISASDH